MFLCICQVRIHPISCSIVCSRTRDSSEYILYNIYAYVHVYEYVYMCVSVYVYSKQETAIVFWHLKSEVRDHQLYPFGVTQTKSTQHNANCQLYRTEIKLLVATPANSIPANSFSFDFSHNWGLFFFSNLPSKF